MTEERLKLAEELGLQTQQALRPGYWIVDSIPLCTCCRSFGFLVAKCPSVIYLPAWLPGMGFKRWCKDARVQFNTFTLVPFLGAKESVVSGFNERIVN